MRIKIISIILFSLLCGSFYPTGIQASELSVTAPQTGETEPAYLHPFSMLGGNLLDIYSSWNSLYHIGAIVSSIILVKTGLDNDIRDYYDPYPWFGRPYTRVMLRVGDFYGLGVASIVYFGGLIGQDAKITAAGAATAQALGISSAVIGAIKLSTGRSIPWKPHQADEFDFFDYKNNVKDKNVYFPSGHTGTTLAVSAALASFYHDQRWVGWVLYPVSALMGFAMLEGSFHWGSDVLAGALMSFVIGYVSGKKFRQEYDKRQMNHKLGLGTSHLIKENNKEEKQKLFWVVRPLENLAVYDKTLGDRQEVSSFDGWALAIGIKFL